ncbi:MAG: heme peroxidase, partial [Actinomycetota bacterium]|nr:heme peroxidase [Actinomycetota bacterium]
MTPSDLAFILKQIKIAEAHAATLSPEHPCDTMIGTGPDQIASPLVSQGLRTVDGSCNNLVPGQETFGAADQTFPRLTTPVFKSAEESPPAFGPSQPTSYAQKQGSVFDSEPRVISNLIVDQTSTNPAAVAAAGNPVRSQGNEGIDPCTTDPDPSATPPVVEDPAGCVPSHQTLFIPNVTTDVGLSPPYNSMFTLFGQFFDHGVDQTVKGGGTVFVPLKDDDPLIAGPDHILGNGDDLPPQLQFMVLTRGKNQPGPDGITGDNPATPADESADDIQNATNTDSPWVDQSQTYTSHSSHQVFVREYVNNADGNPVSTGKLLGGPAGPTAGGMATWATTKSQAETLLGLKLEDKDATNIPMIAADPYGKFLPGPLRGLPQYVTGAGLIEGDKANPVP